MPRLVAGAGVVNLPPAYGRWLLVGQCRSLPRAHPVPVVVHSGFISQAPPRVPWSTHSSDLTHKGHTQCPVMDSISDGSAWKRDSKINRRGKERTLVSSYRGCVQCAGPLTCMFRACVHGFFVLVCSARRT